MRRRALLLAALAAAVVVAVVGGLAATAFDAGDGGTAKPTGTETRLRIQPHEERVACSGDKQAVDVFLDDLQARPGGLAAFQLTLLYDPSILRVEKPGDAQMNPTLASAQTAGGMRAFIAGPTTVDNLEGWVFFGAVGIPYGDPFDPAAQGPDPVARGEPMLLFTVNFQTVGEGTSPLVVYRPEEQGKRPFVPEMEVLDYGGREYVPVVVADSSLTVTAGDCAPAAAVTARPTQVLPTPFPTPTPPVIRPWRDVTPVPAVEAGRADCPEGWNAYSDPDGHFSLCYPPGLDVSASERPSPGRGIALGISSPPTPADTDSTRDNSFYLAVRWNSTSNFRLGSPSPQTCPDYTGPAYPSLVTSSEFLEVATGMGKARICVTTGTTRVGGPQVKWFEGEIALPSGDASGTGFIDIAGHFRGPDFVRSLEAWQQIVRMLSAETMP